MIVLHSGNISHHRVHPTDYDASMPNPVALACDAKKLRSISGTWENGRSTAMNIHRDVIKRSDELLPAQYPARQQR